MKVDPLYRLGKGGRHDEGCIYDFDAQVGRLHVCHAGVIEKDGDVYVLALDSALGGERAARLDSVGDPRSKLVFEQGHGPRLNETLRAAADIVRLLRKFEEDPSARGRFRARYGGQTIGWSEFCFDAAHDAKRLHSTLSNIDPKSDHPRAVVGRIDHVRHGAGQDESAYLAVRDDPEDHNPVKAGDGIPIAPVLRAKRQLRIAEGELIVGYGRWQLWTPESGRRRYITLWVDERRGAVAVLRHGS